jgi:glutathione S-transferase
MSKRIKLYSFGDFDRSGKVRWTATELDYEIGECRLSFPDQRSEDYCKLNPYAQVPTVELDGKILIESTATAVILAERHPEHGLIPESGEFRESFWQSLSVSGSTLEQLTVNYYLAKAGLIDGAWADLVGESIADRLQVFADSMPGDGYICGDFTLADICAAYPLRIAVKAGLLQLEGQFRSYLERLMERPAAQAARFFHHLET